jgi:hypothetical protein
MSKQAANKAVVGRWFTDFWGKNVNLAVADEIAAPDSRRRHGDVAPSMSSHFGGFR